MARPTARSRWRAVLPTATHDVRVVARARIGAEPRRPEPRDARRRGARYFALLDSDDVWHPTFLAAQMEIFNGSPDVDVVTGNAYNLGGGFDGLPLSPVASYRRPISLLDMLERENAVCIMSVFRRAVYETIGGFDEAVEVQRGLRLLDSGGAGGFPFRSESGSARALSPAGGQRIRRRDRDARRDREVLRRRAARCADMPMALAIIDRQIARFEGRRLLVRAKAKLLRREFGSAADEFEALADSGPASSTA